MYICMYLASQLVLISINIPRAVHVHTVCRHSLFLLVALLEACVYICIYTRPLAGI